MPVKNKEKKRLISKKANEKYIINEKKRTLSPAAFEKWYNALMKKREEMKAFRATLTGLTDEEIEKLKHERLKKKRRDHMKAVRIERPDISVKEHKEPVKTGWRGMVPAVFKGTSRVHIEWPFKYFSKKYGCKNQFPTLFNSKKVIRFDNNLRPIGEGDIDLIEDFHASRKDGFKIAKPNNDVFSLFGGF